MPSVQLGTSDLRVRPLCFGGNVFGWTADRDTSFEILDGFVEGGGDFIDTADQYSVWVDGNGGGESETIIGEWLADRRPEGLTVATKVGKHPDSAGLAPDTVVSACEGSLRRLGVEAIDLYYAHEDDPSVAMEESVRAFGALQAAGKIRHVGLSNFAPERLRAWVEAADALSLPRPVVLQPHYNLVERSAEQELLPAARDAGMSTVPYYSLASGFLTGKYRTPADLETGARGPRAGAYATDAGWRVVEALVDIAEARAVEPATVALAWLRTREGVAAPIASASRPAQLPALLASIGFELAAADVERLTIAGA
ncbi:aldo/keto reductase [Agrococcus sediminis]|uniref:aldo/keto reductase n=1 Tax=Agrococcus sediminis TaxID=2599924 RepID=UPI0037FA2B0E